MDAQRKKPGPKPMEHPKAKCNWRIDARIFQWLADRGKRAGSHHIEASLLLWMTMTADQRERFMKRCQLLERFSGPVEEFAGMVAKHALEDEGRGVVSPAAPEVAARSPSKHARLPKKASG